MLSETVFKIRGRIALYHKKDGLSSKKLDYFMKTFSVDCS